MIYGNDWHELIHEAREARLQDEANEQHLRERGMKKMQHCFNCGAEIGIYDRMPGDHDTCGARECEREARNAYIAERDEAHEKLDRDMGWGQW